MGLLARVVEKLFNLDPIRCTECDHLRLLIEQERVERARMLNAILNTKEDNPNENQVPPSAFKPLKERYTPWSVIKAELETKDRIKALSEQKAYEERILSQKLKETDPNRAAEIAKLEKELEVEDASEERKAI